MRTQPLCLLCLLASPALGQITDIGFDEVTSSADLDLVVVRERSYGAGGVDLTSLGLPPALNDYVQSIYVRARHGDSATQCRIVRGRLIFPAGATVIGLVMDGSLLGGSADDGVLTLGDALFGLAGMPADDYSAPQRGSEGTSDSDLVCLRPNNTVEFFLYNNFDDVDDFRVIIDYGSSFPSGLAFDVELYFDDDMRAVESQPGIRVGDSGGAVLASGDYGEVQGLQDIPLTAAVGTSGAVGRLIDMDGGLYVSHSGGPILGGITSLERYDPVEHTFYSHARRTGGGGLARGPYGYIYGLQNNLFGFSFAELDGGGLGFQPVSGITTTVSTIFGIEGTNELLVAGHIAGNNSDVRVYRIDVDHAVTTHAHTVLQSDLSGIVDAVQAGGLIHLLSAQGQYVRMDPDSGTYVPSTIALPGSHAYADMESNAAGTELYLLRQVPFGGGMIIDTIDVATGQPTLDVVFNPDVPHPRGITRDDAGDVWVVNRGNFELAIIAAWDPATWTCIHFTECGANNETTDIVGDVHAATLGTRFCDPALPSGAYPAWISIFGSKTAADDDFHLVASGMPSAQFGYFVNGVAPGTPFTPPGSMGNFCLNAGSGIGRHNSQIFQTSAWGDGRIQVDLNAFPRQSGPTVVQPGDTYCFQAWHRTAAGSSNFTDGICVTFD